jgi:hypothetical protein
MTVWKSAERLWLTEGGMELIEDTDWRRKQQLDLYT